MTCVDKLSCCYKLTCILATIGTTSWCFYIFIQNNDVCLVNYIQYNTNKNFPYPSISIVIGNPFIKDNFKEYGENITASKYSQFLEGKIWDERMLNISYDSVTVDIKDYFLKYEIVFGGGESQAKLVYEKQNTSQMEKEGWMLPYVSFRGHEMKAFTIDMPYKKNRLVKTLAIHLKTSILPGPNNTRPQERNYNSSDDDFGSFEVYFHYPGQFLRSWLYGIGKWYWPKRTDDNSESYEMEFHIRGNDIMKLRNKHGSTCDVNWLEYDVVVLEYIMKSASWRPPQINLTQNLPLCSSTTSLQKVNTPSYQTLTNQTPPCQSVQHSHFDYEDIDVDDKLNPPEIRLEIDSSHPTFKYIEHIKAFDAQSLIGNSGGYLGLFLGYALIQLPSAISELVRVFEKSTVVLK